MQTSIPTEPGHPDNETSALRGFLQSLRRITLAGQGQLQDVLEAQRLDARLRPVA